MQHEEMLEGLVFPMDVKRQRSMLEALFKFSDQIEGMKGEPNVNIAMLYSSAIKIFCYTGFHTGFAGFDDVRHDQFRKQMVNDLLEDFDESFARGRALKVEKDSSSGQ